MSQLDRITLDRIQTAHPILRSKLTDQFKEMSAMLPDSYMLRFSHVLRTFKEQNELFEQGRTKLFDNKGKRLGIVTWARGGSSYHNYGLAFDFCLLKDADGNGTFESVDWTERRYSKEIVKYFKEDGGEWGCDFPKWKEDYPHFQKTYGLRVNDLYAKYMTCDFIAGTTYVNI